MYIWVRADGRDDRPFLYLCDRWCGISSCMKHAVIATFFGAALIAFTAPVIAGPLEDALTSYQRGDYAIALKELRPLADNGDASAQFTLALMYHDGKGAPQNLPQAYAWVRKAANQGNPDAENLIGDMYAIGQGVAANKAAAFSWTRKAAEQGNAIAQYRLGIAYVDGKGTTQDDARAVTWFRKAAVQGNSDAQFWLGLSYDQAAGVPQDYAAALSWYRKSAERGNALGQYALGVMYFKGHGVAQDLVQAHQWFELSAAQESDLRVDAGAMLAKIATQITPAQIAQAQKQAHDWKPKRAEASTEANQTPQK